MSGAASHPRAAPLWRRAALSACALAFAVLWAGGVLTQWLGLADERHHAFAALFLFLSGLIVLCGAGSRRDALALAFVALFGFAVEALGVHTGVPFGEYVYTGALRPRLFGVPVVMGFAWAALVAFACELTRRFGLPAWPAALAAALLTTATDLVIDPLAANHFHYWTWAQEGHYYGIPFLNFVGWYATALVACRAVGPRPRPNPWAVFVGLGILLFFALIALAHALYGVALIGLALCAASVFIARRFRPAY